MPRNTQTRAKKKYTYMNNKVNPFLRDRKGTNRLLCNLKPEINEFLELCKYLPALKFSLKAIQ